MADEPFEGVKQSIHDVEDYDFADREDPGKPSTDFAPKVVSYDPDPHREKMRGQLALGLLGLLAFVIVAAFVTLWLTLWFQSPAPSEILRVLEIILGPVVSLVGAVTGFYYGSVRERR